MMSIADQTVLQAHRHWTRLYIHWNARPIQASTADFGLKL